MSHLSDLTNPLNPTGNPMNSSKTGDTMTNLGEQANQSVANAFRATQRVANDAIDGMAHRVEDMRHAAAPLLDQRVAEKAGAFTQRSLDVVRDGAQMVRDQAQRAQDGTVHYIQSEPVKAMLIAAGAGAALMALLHLMTGPRYRG
jgi:hypothetical protein